MLHLHTSLLINALLFHFNYPMFALIPVYLLSIDPFNHPLLIIVVDMLLSLILRLIIIYFRFTKLSSVIYYALTNHAYP